MTQLTKFLIAGAIMLAVPLISNAQDRSDRKILLAQQNQIQQAPRALNPQPIPPGKTNELNPQPIPPGSQAQRADERSGTRVAKKKKKSKAIPPSPM